MSTKLPNSVVLVASVLLLSSVAIGEQPPSTFCQRNPESRACKTGVEVLQDEKRSLEEECNLRPNTDRCKERAIRQKVKKERMDYCDKNPEQCAARTMRRR